VQPPEERGELRGDREELVLDDVLESLLLDFDPEKSQITPPINKSKRMPSSMKFSFGAILIGYFNLQP
jgi:hypothetical protein